MSERRTKGAATKSGKHKHSGRSSVSLKGKFNEEEDSPTWQLVGVSVLFVLVLALAIVSSVYCILGLRKSYCRSKSEGGGCVTCPDHAFCERNKFQCADGYKKRYRYCVVSGSDEDTALHCLDTVNRALHTNYYRTVRELSKVIDCRFLELAVNMTDEFEVNNGEIQVVDDLAAQKRKQQFQTVLPFTFWLFLLYLIYSKQV